MNYSKNPTPLTCDVCDKPFTPEEVNNDCHFPHEDDCPKYRQENNACDCSPGIAHPECCPECVK